jgi:hypothetical protein
MTFAREVADRLDATFLRIDTRAVLQTTRWDTWSPAGSPPISFERAARSLRTR